MPTRLSAAQRPRRSPISFGGIITSATLCLLEWHQPGRRFFAARGAVTLSVIVVVCLLVPAQSWTSAGMVCAAETTCRASSYSQATGLGNGGAGHGGNGGSCSERTSVPGEMYTGSAFGDATDVIADLKSQGTGRPQDPDLMRLYGTGSALSRNQFHAKQQCCGGGLILINASKGLQLDGVLQSNAQVPCTTDASQCPTYASAIWPVGTQRHDGQHGQGWHGRGHWREQTRDEQTRIPFLGRLRSTSSQAVTPPSSFGRRSARPWRRLGGHSCRHCRARRRTASSTARAQCTLGVATHRRICRSRCPHPPPAVLVGECCCRCAPSCRLTRPRAEATRRMASAVVSSECECGAAGTIFYAECDAGFNRLIVDNGGRDTSAGSYLIEASRAAKLVVDDLQVINGAQLNEHPGRNLTTRRRITLKENARLRLRRGQGLSTGELVIASAEIVGSFEVVDGAFEDVQHAGERARDAITSRASALRVGSLAMDPLSKVAGVTSWTVVGDASVQGHVEVFSGGGDDARRWTAEGGRARLDQRRRAEPQRFRSLRAGPRREHTLRLGCMPAVPARLHRQERERVAQGLRVPAAARRGPTGRGVRRGHRWWRHAHLRAG